MSRNSDSRAYGIIGEDYAISLLQSKGYRIVVRNFRCKIGEIDIIAEDGSTLVFVEVKTRRSLRYGSPEEAVTPHKIKKIKKVIDYYLFYNLKYKKVRIEVVALKISDGKIQTVKIIPLT